MEPIIGQIQAFGFQWAPQGWLNCDGSSLAISQYQSLYSLIGTTYGGDGVSTFKLPDLRGRTAINQGTGPGLTPRLMGQSSGSEINILNVQQMPSHNHLAVGTVKSYFAPPTGGGTSNNPNGLNFSGSSGTNVYTTQAANGTMAAENVNVTVGNNGGNAPVNNMEPYLVVNWCIAWQGVYPQRP
ncbi:MAG: phage tail protein [Flavobacteriales bacterium]